MEISPIEMYNLPSDVYSPRCSPSGSENRFSGGSEPANAPVLGTGIAEGSTRSPDSFL